MPTIKYHRNPAPGQAKISHVRAPKPRSRAKPRKTKTCPICAERFTASKVTQKFCSGTCRYRAHTGVIPQHVSERAEAIRAQRTENRKRAAERAAKDKTRKAEAERIASIPTLGDFKFPADGCDGSCFPFNDNVSVIAQRAMADRKARKERS